MPPISLGLKNKPDKSQHKAYSNFMLVPLLAYSSTLKMEDICPSETAFYLRKYKCSLLLLVTDRIARRQ
jgi:hypothetical protein